MGYIKTNNILNDLCRMWHMEPLQALISSGAPNWEGMAENYTRRGILKLYLNYIIHPLGKIYIFPTYKNLSSWSSVHFHVTT
jgi:hypothetical protein